MTSPKVARLDGLDLARFLAFFGMVVVNFKIVMGVTGPGTGITAMITELLEGKAAATFVVLAGVGLGLTVIHGGLDGTRMTTLRRAVFLLVIGLSNTLIFDADILHYYAFYFLFGMMCLGCSDRVIVWLMAAVTLGFVALAMVFDYETGWDWTNYTYEDFWTLAGFVRNLFFNGWHPVLPWLAFFLFGIWLSRRNLSAPDTQQRMLICGIAGVVIVEFLAWGVAAGIGNDDPELRELGELFLTAPIPPGPLFIVTGICTATAVIALCLLIARGIGSTAVFRILTAPGRQTLTLYVAHILLGMGAIEALGMLGGQTLGQALAAAVLFCLIATVYAAIWAQFFKRGPIEMLMRKLAG